MSSYQYSVKMSNKLLLLQTIKKDHPISRAALAQKLGLTKATVSTLVDELIDGNYCYQTGLGQSSGGRRPLMLQFNEKAGFTVSIDIGVNYLLGILTDLQGTVVNEVLHSFNTNNLEGTIDEMQEMIDYLVRKGDETPYGLVGIGFAIPGLVNSKGDILATPNLDWHEPQIKKIFEDIYQVPVNIENEANAGAYGEKSFGSAKHVDHAIYVSAGIGIGVGLILNNQLYRGAHGFTGEMGHMIIERHGASCRCGSKGCWELYASEMALLDRYKELSKNTETASLEDLIQLANHDDTIRHLFEEVGTQLGVGINNIINTFNPEKVIIGNRLSKAKDLLLPSIVDVVSNQTISFMESSVDIQFTSLHPYSSALGMSAFSIDGFLNRQFL
ncbi:ROK family transcriptional regulator [Salipaludibacillus daqingensis]|uniref:ROK family transcriptional regulator n=1 Tax=Salipaludibacillus daqingensis TaxID=3041001 RepID=UPI002475ACAE|nr:ROK family transcriptional regulator [Salipaludibacillus daqingensis]